MHARAQLLGFTLLTACGPGPLGRPPALPAGARVDVVLPLLDSDRTVDLGGFPGRVVVVHFFATWSLAAEEDVRALRKLRAAYGSKLEVIGVALDPPGNAPLLPPFVQALRIDYPVALATPPLREGRTVFGKIVMVPTTVLIDRAGRYRGSAAGPLAPRDLQRQIDALM